MNKVWMLMLSLPLSLSAQTTLNPEFPPRPLSLQEALRMTVTNNLELQVARYEPEIARYDLAATYGIYDPIFNASATHNLRVREATSFNPVTGVPFPDVETKSDALSAGVSGFLPTGLRYDLLGTFDHSFGRQGFSAFDNYESDVGIGLRQPLLRNFWIDQNRLQIKLARQDLKISEHTFNRLLMDVVNRTQQGYYELIAARDEIVAREKAVELAERFAAETRRRVELGTLPPLDEKLAESEAATARAELIAARQITAARENELKNLVTDNYELWHASTVTPTERLVAVPETYDLGASWLNGITRRPDFLVIKEEVERQGVVVKFYRNQMFPTLDLVGTYGRAGFDVASQGRVITNRIVRGGRDLFQAVTIPSNEANFSDTLADINSERNPRYSYGVVATIPFTFRRERNNLKAAKLTFAQQQDRLKQKHQQILVEIENALTQTRANFERVEATRQARIFNESALEAEQKKMEAGRSTPFNVLQIQRNVTDARSAEIRTLADYNKSLAQLSFYEGTILDRNRISVEYR